MRMSKYHAGIIPSNGTSGKLLWEVKPPLGVDKRLQLLAKSGREGVIRLKDVQRDSNLDIHRVSKVLMWLDREGFVFPLGRGTYAAPAEDLPLALAGRDPTERLASWLPGWLNAPANGALLPAGLKWNESSFIELRLRQETNLMWAGPGILVPIYAGTERLGRVYNKMPIMAYDAAFPPQERRLSTGVSANMPYKRELVRILSVHNDPRLQEAALEIELPAKTLRDLQQLVSRTDPPMPFPDPKVRLPAGPPFRYRLYAPLWWVRRNLEFSHPSRGRGVPRRSRT